MLIVSEIDRCIIISRIVSICGHLHVSIEEYSRVSKSVSSVLLLVCLETLQSTHRVNTCSMYKFIYVCICTHIQCGSHLLWLKYFNLSDVCVSAILVIRQYSNLK